MNLCHWPTGRVAIGPNLGHNIMTEYLQKLSYTTQNSCAYHISSFFNTLTANPVKMSTH